MPSEPKQYLSSDELRQLTLRRTVFAQMLYLDDLNIDFSLDLFGCPLVLYQDAKQYFPKPWNPPRVANPA
jgi:hypothetical protein